MNFKDIILSKLVTKEQMLYDFYSDEVVKIIKAENRKLVSNDGGGTRNIIQWLQSFSFAR